MTPDKPTPDKLSPDKLSIIVFSGDFERVHYALAMAAAAAAVDRPTTLFFTMEAIGALAKRRGDGAPGWSALKGASARDAVQEALRLKSGLSLSYLAKTLPTKHPGGIDPYLDGLRKAGLPE